MTISSFWWRLARTAPLRRVGGIGVGVINSSVFADEPEQLTVFAVRSGRRPPGSTDRAQRGIRPRASRPWPRPLSSGGPGVSTVRPPFGQILPSLAGQLEAVGPSRSPLGYSDKSMSMVARRRGFRRPAETAVSACAANCCMVTESFGYQRATEKPTADDGRLGSRATDVLRGRLHNREDSAVAVLDNVGQALSTALAGGHPEKLHRILHRSFCEPRFSRRFRGTSGPVATTLTFGKESSPLGKRRIVCHAPGTPRFFFMAGASSQRSASH